MADEGLINIEDDSPAPPAPPAAAPPAVETPPTQPEDAHPAEVEAVEVGGQKYVPVAAVVQERKQRQALQERAARADTLEQEIAAARPYVEFLRANPQLMQSKAPEPPPAPAASPQADDDVLEYARALSLYKPDGTPDLDQAGKLLSIAEKRAEKKAQAAVQPILQQSAKQQSEANFQRALALKDGAGRTPNEQHLRALWNTMAPEYTADPQVAAMLTMTAFGAGQLMAKPAVAPPAAPPVFTESVGAVPKARAPMTEFESRVARERGIKPADWQEHTKNHQPGRPTVIEE